LILLVKLFSAFLLSILPVIIAVIFLESGYRFRNVDPLLLHQTKAFDKFFVQEPILRNERLKLD
jgi:hypothetical protein